MSHDNLDNLNKAMSCWKQSVPTERKGHVWNRINQSLNALESKASFTFKIPSIPALGLATAFAILVFVSSSFIYQYQEKTALNSYIWDLANGSLSQQFDIDNDLTDIY